MSDEYATRIYFEDECPRIGSGFRSVFVKEGRKWATITERGTGRKQRITLDQLDRIESTKRNAQ